MKILIPTTVCNACGGSDTSVAQIAVLGKLHEFDLCDTCREAYQAAMQPWMEIALRQSDAEAGAEDTLVEIVRGGVSSKPVFQSEPEEQPEADGQPVEGEAPGEAAWLPETPKGVVLPKIKVGAAWWPTPKNATTAQRQACADRRAGLWDWARRQYVNGEPRFPQLTTARPTRGAFPADVGHAWTEEVWAPLQSRGQAKRPKVESLNGVARRASSRRRR